jgi:hypothetical protein
VAHQHRAEHVLHVESLRVLCAITAHIGGRIYPSAHKTNPNHTSNLVSYIIQGPLSQSPFHTSHSFCRTLCLSFNPVQLNKWNPRSHQLPTIALHISSSEHERVKEMLREKKTCTLSMMGSVLTPPVAVVEAAPESSGAFPATHICTTSHQHTMFFFYQLDVVLWSCPRSSIQDALNGVQARSLASGKSSRGLSPCTQR